MNGSMTFTSEILAHAKSQGVQLSHADVEAINQKLGSITRVEDDKLIFTAGHYINAGEAVEAMSAGHGKPVEKPAIPSAPHTLDLPATATATQRAAARNASIQAGSDDAKRAHAETLVQTWGNPWASDRINRSHQGYITNHNRKLAGRLRREAGVRT